MAARKTPSLSEAWKRKIKSPARFYVYRFDDAAGSALYIGKGSGRRLNTQQRRLGRGGYEIARFWREADAYAFERQAIKEFSPFLNKAPGGNGARATLAKAPRRQAWEIEMERIGTRAYVARFLLARCLPWIDPSKVDQIRAVACGG